MEENAVDHILILIGDRGNLFRHSEDDVEVLDGQQFGLAVFEPLSAGEGLALGTVTIPTRNGDLSISCLGLNRYAVAEADISIKTRQSASTSPSHM